MSYDDDVSSSSSDDDVHRIKGGTGAPRTYTDQGLVDMVYNCKDENTVNAVISCYMNYQ